MHPITPSSSTQPTFSFGLSSNVKSFGMDPGASTPFFGPAKPASTTTSTEDFTHGICTLHQAVQGQDIAIIDNIY